MATQISNTVKKRGSDGTYKKQHGFSGTPTYNVWKDMVHRCTIVTHHAWARYGGRGITVCTRWHKFERFLDDMGLAPKGLTLDRINNDGPYSPKNCQWSDRKHQANNRSSNRIIEYRGESLTASQWADRIGINSGRIRKRLADGWSVEESMTLPIQKSRWGRKPPLEA